MPTYTGISSEAFRHPADRQAEQTLRSLPGFELLANRFIEYFYERPQNIYWLGNGIQAGVRQYSTLYGIFGECVRDLDVYPEPNLYVSQNPYANSHALGRDRPYLVVNTEILELMSEAELRVVPTEQWRSRIHGRFQGWVQESNLAILTELKLDPSS